MLFHVPHRIPKIDALSTSTRSLILNLYYKDLPPHVFRQPRVSDSNIMSNEFLDNARLLVNLQIFSAICEGAEFPSLIWQIWNLQTLVLNRFNTLFTFTVPSDIWYISHIMHIYIDALHLPDPPRDVRVNDTVLSNQQTMEWIRDFRFSE